MRRIAVLGCSGSGKSTLAAALAARLALPYVATDAVFWTADWRPTPAAEVRAWLDAATAADSWVTDGNFDGDRDLYGRSAPTRWSGSTCRSSGCWRRACAAISAGGSAARRCGAASG